MESMTKIWACGQFLLKPAEKTNTLNYPVMVEVHTMEA